MNWRSGLSDDDVKEMVEDSCKAYQKGEISFKELVLSLAKLGCNATEIADYEKDFRPEPPENDLEV